MKPQYVWINYFGKTQKYGMIYEKKYTSISTLVPQVIGDSCVYRQ